MCGIYLPLSPPIIRPHTSLLSISPYCYYHKILSPLYDQGPKRVAHHCVPKFRCKGRTNDSISNGNDRATPTCNSTDTRSPVAASQYILKYCHEHPFLPQVVSNRLGPLLQRDLQPSLSSQVLIICISIHVLISSLIWFSHLVLGVALGLFSLGFVRSIFFIFVLSTCT